MIITTTAPTSTFIFIYSREYNNHKMDKTDEELVAYYLRGDEKAAFSDLVERHLKGVYSFALRFVGSKEEAEDIAQETFFKAWKNLKKYQQQTSKFKTWLLHIARNSAIDFLR